MQDQHETRSDSRAPDDLREIWIESGAVPRYARWIPLVGGRSNQVWQVSWNDQVKVCKLFLDNGATPLFANDSEAAQHALRALVGSGLAPELVAVRRTTRGISHLMSYVPGRRWTHQGRADEVVGVARLLARLHACIAPDSLPTAPALPDAPVERTVVRTGPGPARAPLSPPVFLHGDPVPGNILSKGATLALIDWQCPSIGEAAHDLALFLSPAMQHVNGNAPLSPAQTARFLTAYGHPGRAARYRDLAPFFHRRMAAYCDWKVRQGDLSYAKAGQFERAALATCVKSAGVPGPV